MASSPPANHLHQGCENRRLDPPPRLSDGPKPEPQPLYYSGFHVGWIVCAFRACRRDCAGHDMSRRRCRLQLFRLRVSRPYYPSRRDHAYSMLDLPVYRPRRLRGPRPGFAGQPGPGYFPRTPLCLARDAFQIRLQARAAAARREGRSSRDRQVQSRESSRKEWEGAVVMRKEL